VFEMKKESGERKEIYQLERMVEELEGYWMNVRNEEEEEMIERRREELRERLESEILPNLLQLDCESGLKMMDIYWSLCYDKSNMKELIEEWSFEVKSMEEIIVQRLENLDLHERLRLLGDNDEIPELNLEYGDENPHIGKLKEEIEEFIQSHFQLLISPILESNEEGNHEFDISLVRRMIEIRNEISKDKEIRQLEELKNELERIINPTTPTK